MGVVCGKVSGIVVLDIDAKTPEGLTDGINYVKEHFHVYANGANSVVTGGGGLHVYFSAPDKKLHNRVKFVKRDTFSLDLRAEGGYVAAPGTMHESGNKYTWSSGFVPNYLPPVPKSLLDAALTVTPIDKGPINMASDIQEGGRDDELTRRVGRLVKSGQSYNDVLAIAISMNITMCKPPLEEHQVVKIVDSVFGMEQRKKAKSSFGFELKKFNQMVDLYSEVTDTWLIKDWVPDATCALITSAPGMFKTWMMLDLAVSISTGKDFLGMYEVSRKGPVMVIQQEDPFPLLMERSGAILNIGPVMLGTDEYIIPAAPDYPDIYFHTERSLRFSDQSVMESFQSAVRTIQPAAVIIDPLYSAAGTDDYMASAAQDMLVLKKLRDETGASFIITHHMNKSKSDGGRSRDRLWGSQFLNAWLETGWQCEPSDVGSVEVTRHFKNTATPGKVVLSFDISEGKFSASEPTVDTMELDDKIAYTISNKSINSISQLMSELGIKSKSTVASALKRIGAVKVNDSYCVPQVGLE